MKVWDPFNELVNGESGELIFNPTIFEEYPSDTRNVDNTPSFTLVVVRSFSQYLSVLFTMDERKTITIKLYTRQ